ncbi:MAG: Stk1 family PASTA domain-containing Ser/Thr kinase [Oscillospiraceae bacterium]|nr:Stk1 family PASTA domain-containing Ser/Thr kinase [Oscillospiraceae bacterium]
MDKYIGKMLDNRYEILEVIGTGGMAMVYKARCHRLNRLVAVKILKDEYLQDDDFRMRFHAESQAVAMLSHPNIVSVYDVSKSSQIEYIVMELIDGMSLKEYMQKKGALSWREALHFITQIMRALEHAHSRGIIHRDIKPHNVMTLRDGSVKVTDFGIAHLTNAPSTLTQEALGSVHYISPEQAKGGKLDCRTDIYSAGVVLYEMLTGRLPFDGDSPVAVALQHINTVPPRPREIDPSIPEGLEEITLKAMNCDMEKRYSSATEMLESLEEFRKDPDISFNYDVDADSEGLSGSESGDDPLRELIEKRKRKKRLRREEEEVRDRSKRAGRVSVLAGIAAVLVFILALTYFLWTFFFRDLFTTSPEITVPDLVGKTLSDVLTDSEYSDFKIIEGSSEESDVYVEGTILKQEPANGTLVKKGNTISVTVSAGSKIVSMPSVVGNSWRQAQQIIKNTLDNKILYSIETFYMLSDDVADGSVISTEPEAGERLRSGANITVIISKGQDVTITAMPNVVGQPLDAAKSELEAHGLTVDTVKSVESEEAAGTVVYQNYAPGSEVEVQSASVTLYVSLGPPPEKPSPSVEPSKEPDQFPAPDEAPEEESTPAPPKEKELMITVALPTGDGTVYLEIWQDDVRLIADTYERSLGSVELVIKGTGKSKISVYCDGVLTSTKTIDFELDG